MKCGRAKCKEAEAKRKDFNTGLIHQDKKFFTFELFKVIQDAIPLILHCKTLCHNFFEYIYHIGCAISLHSITNSGLIPGGKIQAGKDRQYLFFTAVNPIDKEHKDPYKIDLTKPRLASYKQKKWKRHQGTVCWVDIHLPQRKGMKFHQTRCNAIILYDTLPAYCISKVVVMESGEIIYEKVHVSPRPPPTISFKDDWLMKELDSEVAGSSRNTQRIQPKPETQLSRKERPVGEQQFTQRSRKMSCLVAKASTQQEREDP